MATNLNNKLKRLYILVSRLKKRAATRQELLNLLDEHGLSIGEATFERDKKTLKDDFGIELMYEASDKNYTIETLDSDELAQIIQFLQFHQLSDALSVNILDGKSSLSFIDFDKEYQLKGIEYLDQLFLATKNHQIIEIKHRKFDTEKAVTYTMKPYLLKQYQSRWYIVGEIEDNKLRTLGVDRIENLTLREDKFIPKDYNLKEKFMGCVGVSDIHNERELILIAFDSSQKEFLENLPLHQSQELIKSTEQYVVYGYYVVINFELRQQILKYGSMAKVMEPKSLADAIKNDLKKALEAY